MAVQQEIFHAKLTIDTNASDVIPELDGLRVSIDRVTDSLRELSDTKIDFDNVGFEDFERRAKESTQEVEGFFSKLRDKIVGRSIIPEMMHEIQAEFAALPDKTRPEVFALQEQFKQLANQARQTTSAIQGGTETNIVAMQGLVEEVMKASGQFDDATIAQAFENIENATEPAKASIEELNKSMGVFKDRVHEVGDAIQQELAEETRQHVAFLSTELQRVGQVGLEQGIGSRVKDVTAGLALMRAEGGNVAVGLRQALFGANQSASVFARGLDFLAAKTGDVSAATNRYAREAERMAEIAERETRTIANQAQVLKDVGAALDVPRGELNRFEGGVVELRREFGKLFTTIEAGGVPTARQLSRVRLAGRGTLQEIQILRERLGDLAPPEVLKSLDQLEERIKTQAKRAEVATANAKAFGAEQKKMVAAQKESAKTGDKQAGVLKRITINFGNLFNITRKTKTEVSQTTNEMREFNQAATRSGRVLDTAKGAFLGFLGAAALVTGLRYAFDGIGFAVRRLAGDILEVNTTMQDFGISVAQQLTGSRLETLGLIDDVEKAVSDFILEVGAKTPFETIELFESIPILVASGLDPQIWLEPMADLAAAMNKPFQQVQFALQKLVAGETGDAIRQFRDMGLVMQDVAIFTNTTTGELIANSDAIKAQKMSAEELADAGWARLGLEFKKSGQLATSTGDTLRIVNGYLQQNAKFAGAAAARSEGFLGVMSNLKDNVNALYLAMGQPVLERMTGSVTGLLTRMNDLMPVLEVVANRVGIWLSGAFEGAVNFITTFNVRFAGLIDVVQRVVAMVASVFSGEWSDAWLIFLGAIDDGLAASESIFQSFISNAFVWGYNFIVEVASGIIDSVGSVLLDALNYVGDTIASFLMPGSAPAKGPLSSIDQWGGELLDVFGASVEEIDTESLERALEDMRDLMASTGEELPEEFVKGFSQINFEDAIRSARAQFGEFMGTFGQLNMDQVLGGLGSADFDFIKSALSPVKDFLKETVGKEGFEPFMRVRESLAAIVSELNQTGKVNEEMFGKISTVLGKHNKTLTSYLRAQLELQAVQKKVSDAEAKGFITKELKEELAQAEAKVENEKELMDWQQETRDLQQEFLGGLKDAAKAMGKAAKAASRMAKRRKKEQLSLQDWYAQEKDLIAEKYRLGILSEQEYTQALLNLEKQYVDRAMKEGIVAGLDQHVLAINELQAKLDAMRKKGGLLPEDALEIRQPEDIYAGFLDNLDEVATQAGETFGGGFMVAMREKMPESVPGVMDAIWLKIREGMGTIFDNVRNWLAQNITPKNFPAFSLVAGLLANIVASPIGRLLTRIGSLFLGGAEGAGAFGVVLRKLLGTVLRFSIIGAIIVTVLLNWEEILATLGPIVDTIAGSLRTFANDVLASIIEKLGGAESATQKFQDVLDSLTAIGADVVAFFTTLPSLILAGDFAAIGASIASVMTKAFEVARTQILPILGSIFLGIGQTIVNALPPQVIEFFQQARDAIAAFFAEGRLGGELLNLMNSLRDLFITLLPLIKAAGIAIGTLAGLIANVLISALQALVDVLPFIERMLSGLIRVIAGVVDMFSALVLAIQAAWAFITGDTEKANTLIQAALGKVADSFDNIFSGIAQIVMNAGAGILALISSFAANFINNIATVLPGATPIFGTTLDEMAAKAMAWKDDVIDVLLGLITGAQEQLFKITELIGMLFVQIVQITAENVSTMFNAGKEVFEGLKDGFETTWKDITDWFEDAVGMILEPVENLKSGVLGIFGGMQDEVVENSIVPDMTNAITGLFSGMESTVKGGLQTFTRQSLTIWTQFANSMVRVTQTMTQMIIELFRRMESVLTAILRDIVALFDEWADAADDVISKLEELPPLLEEIGNYKGAIEELADAFGELRDAILDAAKEAADLISYLERVAELQDEIHGGAPPGEQGGGESEFQTGAWRIPRTMSAILHKGETVLPPAAAQAFRDLVTSLRGSDLGFAGLTMAPAMAGNASSVTYNAFGPGAFEGAFPNVRDGRDASGFINELNNMTRIAAVKSSVVGSN